MFNRLKNLLTPPVFADEEQTRLARLLTILLRGMIVTIVVTAPVLIALMPASERVFLLLISVAAVTILVGLFLVTQRGHVRLASAALPSALLVIVTVGISDLASLREVVTSAYLIIIVVAGLLLGGRGALVFMGLSVLAALGVLSAEAYGWITPTQPSTGLRMWIVYSVLFGVMAWLLALTTRSIREGLEEARRLSLERRTRERMAQALQRVGAAITASLDLPTVLPPSAPKPALLSTLTGSRSGCWRAMRPPFRPSPRMAPAPKGCLANTSRLPTQIPLWPVRCASVTRSSSTMSSTRRRESPNSSAPRERRRCSSR